MELVLITISGQDRPGITAEFSLLLAEQGANILDLGQSVIHEQLSLGILAQVDQDPAKVEARLLECASILGMRVRFTRVSEASYAAWVQQQGKPRYIVTLLSRCISAEQIHRVSALLSEYALNIDNITRLSGRVPLHTVADKKIACVEFSVRGDLPLAEDKPREVALRESLLSLASEYEIDIAIQHDNLFRRNRRLVVFDMDSTLIQVEVIDELAKHAGVGDEVAAITERAMRGEIDFQQSFRERVALLKGMPETVLAEVAANLPLTEGAEKLIAVLRRLGYKTAILSGGFTYFGHLLKQKLGMDYMYANQLAIDKGVVTGEVLAPIVDGERKATLLRELAEKENISLEQVIAVGDGANDLPMLGIAGLGVAFHAKPLVKANAKQALSAHGLDGILYLLGLTDKELM